MSELNFHIERSGCLSVGVADIPKSSCNGRAVGHGLCSGISVANKVIIGFSGVSGKIYVGAMEHSTMALSYVDHEIIVNAGQVCQPDYGNYLRVTPVETMWIDVGFDIDYFIRSNTNWIVN